VEVGGATCRGSYTLRGGTLTLRVANDRDRLLFTLKPAARKPQPQARSCLVGPSEVRHLALAYDVTGCPGRRDS
jgi:hypothetical protein